MTTVRTPANFTELGLITPLLARLAELEYQQPTPIQTQAIPSVLAGRDLMCNKAKFCKVCRNYALKYLQAAKTVKVTLLPD